MTILLVLLLAAAVAIGVYRFVEGPVASRALLVLLRTAAGALLGLLLLDLSCARLGPAARPLVLVDASLSMDAAGGRGAEARDSAAQWGEVRPFGADPTGPASAPGFGRSALAPALVAAAAGARPVVVVTDGAVSDATEIPSELLDRVTVRTFPRHEVADAAVLRIEGAAQVALGDTLFIEATLGRWGSAADHGQVAVSGERGAALVTRAVRFDGASAELLLPVPSRLLGAGDHLLHVRMTVAGDVEPQDDVRDLLVRVTTLPGVVVLASPPDWDARQLHATLQDVAQLPVKGFARFGAAGWRTMEDRRAVRPEEVARAARGADLLVIKGDPTSLPAGAHPKGIWWWPSGEGGETQLDGDWYPVLPATSSPVGMAWGGVPLDSLAPLERVVPIEPGPREWIGLTAQAGRRGAARPVLVGHDSGRVRVAYTAADGLWRWAFRPGASEEGYRQWVAATTNWLLGATDSVTGAATPLRRVVARGAPLRFARRPGGATVSLIATFIGPTLTRTDTLVFDGNGVAETRLPSGAYAYALQGGGRGMVAVESWSEEYVPRPATLNDRTAAAGAGVRRLALRDKWWLYLLVAVLLAIEWTVRRRAGLR